MNDVALDVLGTSNYEDSVSGNRNTSAQENLLVHLEDFLLLKGHILHGNVVQNSERTLGDEVAVCLRVIVSQWFSACLNNFRFLHDGHILSNWNGLYFVDHFRLLRLNFFNHNVLFGILNLLWHVLNQVDHLVLFIILAHVNDFSENRLALGLRFLHGLILNHHRLLHLHLLHSFNFNSLAFKFLQSLIFLLLLLHGELILSFDLLLTNSFSFLSF